MFYRNVSPPHPSSLFSLCSHLKFLVRDSILLFINTFLLYISLLFCFSLCSVLFINTFLLYSLHLPLFPLLPFQIPYPVQDFIYYPVSSIDLPSPFFSLHPFKIPCPSVLFSLFPRSSSLHFLLFPYSPCVLPCLSSSCSSLHVTHHGPGYFFPVFPLTFSEWLTRSGLLLTGGFLSPVGFWSGLDFRVFRLAALRLPRRWRAEAMYILLPRKPQAAC